MTLQGKVALVTGAGSGLGKATSIKLAREGAKVANLGRSEDELKSVTESIQNYGGEALSVLADISKPDEMQRAYEQVMQQWGRLDIVFANAGVNGLWAPIDEITVDEWDKTIDINLKGTFLTIKYAVPHLKQNGGAIVVTSSVNGTRMFSNTGATVYATSKAGQVAMTKMLAPELAQDNIRINVICPGAIESNIDENTEQRDVDEVKIPADYPEGAIPLTGKTPGKAEQVADLVHFLVTDASSHITGTEIWIDGGQSLIQG